ncbi:hypothetical protein ARMSODRAFT_969126 [Armillaria solidipes]|uniref:Uncharacterized protein n=1 Tax=Armillaria solidipes TaxID=1076256 RepID=A0A2H3BZZ5_9AGAR|nr:hypothetical protein ARMSODRAFT_969126 [Armillaria solidipes]
MTVHYEFYQPETGWNIIWILELDGPPASATTTTTTTCLGSALFVAPFTSTYFPIAVSTPDQEAVKPSESIDYAAPPSRQARSTEPTNYILFQNTLTKAPGDVPSSNIEDDVYPKSRIVTATSTRAATPVNHHRVQTVESGGSKRCTRQANLQFAAVCLNSFLFVSSCFDLNSKQGYVLGSGANAYLDGGGGCARDGGGRERKREIEEMAVVQEACEGGRLVDVGRNVCARRASQYRPRSLHHVGHVCTGLTKYLKLIFAVATTTTSPFVGLLPLNADKDAVSPTIRFSLTESIATRRITIAGRSLREQAQVSMDAGVVNDRLPYLPPLCAIQKASTAVQSVNALIQSVMPEVNIFNPLARLRTNFHDGDDLALNSLSDPIFPPIFGACPPDTLPVKVVLDDRESSIKAKQINYPWDLFKKMRKT